MVWRVFTLERVTGDLEVITIFSPEEAWVAFLSQSRFSREIDSDRYKAWIECLVVECSLEHSRHLTSVSSM